MKGVGVLRGPSQSDALGARASYIIAVVGCYPWMKMGTRVEIFSVQHVTKKADPALLCLPVTQYDENSSEEGGSDAASYVSDEDQCCCGCGQDASDSRHYCLYSMKRVCTILLKWQ